jgi:ABC-type uncharacterized transport system fused permease/ATPase subunit
VEPHSIVRFCWEHRKPQLDQTGSVQCLSLIRDMSSSVSRHRQRVLSYTFWSALIYAGTASWLSWLVGRPLIPLNADHYAKEADLRFALVWLNEHIDSVALYGGEQEEKQRLIVALERVLQVMGRIVGASTRLTWITSGYGWSTIVVPFCSLLPVISEASFHSAR